MLKLMRLHCTVRETQHDRVKPWKAHLPAGSSLAPLSATRYVLSDVAQPGSVGQSISTSTQKVWTQQLLVCESRVTSID